MTTRILSAILLFLTAIGTAVSPANSPATSPLLITEVFYDTPGMDGEQEWIEIAAMGTAVIDLSDIKIGDEESPGGGEGMVRFPAGADIAPGQVIVVAQTAVGFKDLYGRVPDYEISDSDTAVPDMRRFPLWADGDLALSNDGDELLLLDGMTIIDQISYGDSRAVFSPPIPGVPTGYSIARIPANCDTDSAADWQAQSAPTPGATSKDGTCAAPVNPAELEDLPPIGVIQGSGRLSPFVNQTVTFRGVVTGMREDINTKGIVYYTLFVQDLPGQTDGDPATSDGIAVFLGRKRGTYHIGDQLRVNGRVAEFYDYTEIEDEGLEIIGEASGVPLPAPISITPPRGQPAQAAYFEPLESMLVALDGAAHVVGPTYSGCGFAVVSADSGLTRVFRRSAADLAGPIIAVLHESDVACADFPHLHVGDSVSGVTGPLIYNFDQFKIVQQTKERLAVTAVPLPPIPAPPTATATQFAIASFNLENHFDAHDDTGSDAEPKPSPADIAIKQTKLAYTIGHTLGCPALIAIQEVENKALLRDLAEETAVICHFTYEVTHRESADSRGIDVALLSDPRRITIADAALRQGCTPIDTGIVDASLQCGGGQQPLFSRPPLQVDVGINGVDYTIFVNHFKSKRGGEAATAARRTAQAQHIIDLVNERQNENDQARIIVLGDFNDYEQSPPLNVMATSGQLTNLLLQIPDADRYSFIFGGNSQLIDGVLVSKTLLDEVTAVTIQHANADFPDSFSHDTSPPHLAYKATDHDLPLVVFTLPQPAPEIPASPMPAPAPPPGKKSPSWLWIGGGLGVVTAVLAIIQRQRRTGSR